MTQILGRGVRAAGRTILRLVVALSFAVLLVFGIGPLTGHYRCVTVLTGSMRPTLPIGSIAISTPERLDQVRVGQVITFRAPIAWHPIVTHRVIQVVETGSHPRIRTKGDANRAPDPWVARLDSGPVWRARAAVPYGGSAIRLVRGHWMHMLSVIGAPLLFVVFALGEIWHPRARNHDVSAGAGVVVKA